MDQGHQHADRHKLEILNDLSNKEERAFEKYERSHTQKISGFEKFKLRYLSVLDKLMTSRKLVISVYLAVTFGTIVFCFLVIGKDILPKLNHGRQFQMRLIGEEGLRIERTEDAVLKVISVINGIVGEENVEITSAFVGMTPSSYGTNSLYIFNSGPQEAILQVNLSEDFAVSSLDDLKDEIRKKTGVALPGIALSFEPIELTDKIMSQGANTPIEVIVASKDINEGAAYAVKVKEALKKVDFLRDVRINQPLNYPMLNIEIDRERAAQFGISSGEIANSLVAATSSSRFTAKNLWLDSKRGFAYEVQVQVPEYQMNSIKDIENIPMVKGQLRPTLSDMATVKSINSPAEYDRIGPRRIVTVSANVFKKDLGSAAAIVREVIQKAGTPPVGMIVEVRGLVKLLEETLSSLQSGLLLAIVVIFLLLSANYQSFKVAFVVLVTIPAVLAGSMVILLLTGDTLNLQSYMGIIMSVGVSVANAVLLVTNAEILRLEYQDAGKAARIAGSVRMRAILMTSIAMVAGMLPLASGLGESGEQTAPLGRAVIGGLIASTFAALLVLPVVFASVQKKTSVKSVSLDPDDRKSEYFDKVHYQN